MLFLALGEREKVVFSGAGLKKVMKLEIELNKIL
jgi:hypothetical protein